MKLSDVFTTLAASPAKVAEVASAVGATVEQVRSGQLTPAQINVALIFLDYDILKKEGR